MARTPLHHIVRVRTSDDLTYISPGLIDEIVINANQSENSIQSTRLRCGRQPCLSARGPVLWRLQVPAWSRNVNGATKRNYKRLGTAYGKGTGLTLGLAPLLDTVY